MTASRPCRYLTFVFTSLLLLAVPAAAGAAIVTNGNFETGNLSGWQVYNSSPATGNWFAYTGSTSPLSGLPVTAPPQGNYAAITDQDDEGLHILYQDLTLPTGGSQDQLSLTVYYISDAPIASPSTLDPSGSQNQQYRIDVMRPGAAIDSMLGKDILRTVFAAHAFSPMELAPTQATTFLPISSAGRTVRLRLAEVDNQGNFNASADAVSVRSNAFTVGQRVLNRKKGTATVPVTVPNDGTLTLQGKGVKRLSGPASGSVAIGEAGTVNLLVKAKGKKKRKLSDKGKVKVKVTITYTPTGLNAASQTAKIKLKKKT
jgi:hypothetical protein